MDQSWPVRVIVGENDIRKVRLPGRPASVEALIAVLKSQLTLDYDFLLHYEDPDFKDFCNLSNIDDLPECGTVKIVSLESVIVTLSPLLNSPLSSPSALSTTSSADTLRPQSTSREPWPSEFEMPYLSVDIEYRLRQGNLIYLKENKRMKVTRDIKHDILQKLAEEMYKYTAYPEDKHYTDVAKALIAKHPCLRESGSSTGYSGWVNSLKFKMGNLRSKLRNCGMADVVCNTSKRQNGDGSSRKGIKRPRRSETNFLPNFPEGHDEEVLEQKREILLCEMKKKKPHLALVNELMNQTFSLRRKEIVEDKPPIQQMLGRWPALFTKQQVLAEFTRVASKDLEKEFFQSLDGFVPRLLELFKAKKGSVGQTLERILAQIETSTHDDFTTLTVVLKCLPVFFGDDWAEFFRVSYSPDLVESQVPVAIMTVVPEGEPLDLLDPHPATVTHCIILEGTVAMDTAGGLSDAFCLTFGLMYALHLDYPKKMRNTFEFVQRVMLNLGVGNLRPKIQTLKNALQD
ncbi:sterile alpha motif domain-containing protein 3-like [Syngnathus typhle]